MVEQVLLVVLCVTWLYVLHSLVFTDCSPLSVSSNVVQQKVWSPLYVKFILTCRLARSWLFRARLKDHIRVTIVEKTVQKSQSGVTQFCGFLVKNIHFKCIITYVNNRELYSFIQAIH